MSILDLPTITTRMSSGREENRSSGSLRDEVERISFERPALKRRGYDVAATDGLIERLIAERQELEREGAALRQQLSSLQGELARAREREQLVSKALSAATNQASAIRDGARREAETILSKARAESERRLERAGQIERKRDQTEREVERLRELQQSVQARLMAFLTEAVEQLRSEEDSNGASGAAVGPHTADEVHETPGGAG
jgi:cell division initiation protein